MASPEITRWCAVPGVLVPVPGQPSRHGMSASYVGRSWDQAAYAAGETELEKLYPANNDDEFCAFARADSLIRSTELLRIAKHGDLVPGDDVTAKWAGLKFKAPAVGPTQPDPQPTQTTTRTRRSTATEGSQ